MIKNYANIELFRKTDLKTEDCIGWITVMEKGEEDLRSLLKENKLDLDQRKKISKEIFYGWKYLLDVGIMHSDLKLENVLLSNGIPKIIDFGLVTEETGREGYRQLGYTRRGTKYRVAFTLC